MKRKRCFAAIIYTHLTPPAGTPDAHKCGRHGRSPLQDSRSFHSLAQNPNTGLTEHGALTDGLHNREQQLVPYSVSFSFSNSAAFNASRKERASKISIPSGQGSPFRSRLGTTARFESQFGSLRANEFASAPTIRNSPDRTHLTDQHRISAQGLVPLNEEVIAVATARSAAGSSIRNPLTTLVTHPGCPALPKAGG